MICNDCIKKDKIIKDLEGQVRFFSHEVEIKTAIIHKDRGGDAFNSIQEAYADSLCENIRLTNELKRIKDEKIKMDQSS